MEPESGEISDMDNHFRASGVIASRWNDMDFPAYIVVIASVRGYFMQKKWELFLSLILIVTVSCIARGMSTVESMSDSVDNRVVVIDAGHGGSDPGKIGVNDALEKDINLSIALKVRDILEKKGITVVMTRETEDGLYQESDTNKKRSDMQKRCEIIAESKCSIAVSIHQNSYHEEGVSGPQVFYYATSTEGQQLAIIIQNELIDQLSPEKKRTAKPNDSYYLLKKAVCPIVIVESGFLSNWNEAQLLVTEEYQQKVAQAVADGVEKHLSLK